MRMLIATLVGCVIFIGHSTFAQPKIPKHKIPGDIDPLIKREIEALYSPDAIKRAYAAHELAQINARARREQKERYRSAPAIPFLIDILDDRTPMKWEGIMFGNETSPGAESAKALDYIGRPAVEPLIAVLTDRRVGRYAADVLKEITGQSFGQNPERWQAWWEQNKTNKLNGEEEEVADYVAILQLILIFVGIIAIGLFIIWLKDRKTVKVPPA